MEINRHFLFYCALFHLAYTVFYKLMFCGNPVSNKSVGAIFSTALTHFVSVKFDNFYNFSCLFIIIFIIVICDFFFYVPIAKRLQLTKGSVLNSFFTNTVFLIKVSLFLDPQKSWVI